MPVLGIIRCTFTSHSHADGTSAYEFWTSNISNPSATFDYAISAKVFFDNAKSDVCYFNIFGQETALTWIRWNNFWGMFDAL